MADKIQQSTMMQHTPEVERALASLKIPKVVDIRVVKPTRFDQTNWNQLSIDNTRRQNAIAADAAKQMKGLREESF